MRAASPRFASRPICRITAYSTKNACSRAARPRGRSPSAASGSASPSARTSGSKNQRNTKTSSNASPRPARKSWSCRTARLTPVTRMICGCRSRLPASPRAACRWSISTRSAGRTNWCSTARRSRSTPIFRWRRNCRPLRRASSRCAGPVVPLVEGDKGDYAACVLGLRDYVRKNGFPGVLLGVSGGIDSALCAAIAVDALGAGRVRGVMLPFRFTAQVSLDDAAKLAVALGIRYEVLPIAEAVNGFEAILATTFAGLPRDITEENLQARTRGTLLMAISNKTGAMVVTTGNKSEMSVGYATIYGDMNGGYNPIKDIYKTEVFRLSALRNSWKPDGALGPSGEVIPVNIITRPPTAELRENQTDQDS